MESWIDGEDGWHWVLDRAIGVSLGSLGSLSGHWGRVGVVVVCLAGHP